MRLSELDYELPPALIAQQPLEHRADARLQVLDRKSGALEYSRFYKLASFMRDGDVLVLNDTRVIPAQLVVRKESGGRVELLLIRPLPETRGAWLSLARSHRRIKEGTRLLLDSGKALRVLGYQRPGRAIVASDDSAPLSELLKESGLLALPHYIRREVGAADQEDYQTVYAAHDGAIAAPTAGLHFTTELLAELAANGVKVAPITHHIGPGTFAPLRCAEVESHSMEAEWYAISQASRTVIEHARRTGARVFAVGTSCVRALESYAITGDAEGFTGLFIYPGFRFRMVEAMITNYHMPRSTVLALVMAFAGREPILKAYRDAIRHRMRFLSYGDAMLIV
jgi:S-adenosylmethionine:tRNA ribosyltransferase-isomerase